TGILPIVRILIPCEHVAIRPQGNKWILTDPWAVVGLPPGASFPFFVPALSLYAQLTDGVGQFDLTVEMRRIREDESREVISRGQTVTVHFPSGQQLAVIDIAFLLEDLFFVSPGLYEFVVVTNHTELQGQSALLRVFD